MKRFFAVPALLLGFWAIASAQEFRFEQKAAPSVYHGYEENLTLPPAMAPVEPFLSRRGWIHFSVFDNGLFSSQDTAVITFSVNGQSRVVKDRKGKYTTQTNPPHAARQVNVSGASTAVIAHVNDPFSLRAAQTDSIHPEWNAAALSDTHYFALVVKNTNPELPKTGTVKLRFPTDAFDYVDTVFLPNPAVFGDPEVETDDGDATHRPGTTYTWPVTLLPPRDSQTIFVRLRIKDNVEDSIQLIQLSTELRIADDTQSGSTTGPFIPVKSLSGSEPRVENPYNFAETNSTQIAINSARDPNSLSVFPQRLPPAASAPAHTLRYTVNVENLGTALARFVLIEIPFTDSRIKTGTPVTLQAVNFPNGGSGGIEGTFESAPPAWNGNTLRMIFNFANLAPAGGGIYSRASFDFEVSTKENIELKVGDVISASALIRLKSSVTSQDDSLWTDPAFVHIERPGRVPFGCILGIKAHTNVFSPDSSLRVRGVDLTFRFPIVNRRMTSLSSQGVLSPRLFWQLEAGWGTSAFNPPNDDGGLFETQYVHFTPALIRYFHPFHINSYFMYAGLSAGYSAGYVFEGKLNGQDATLPSGFGKRLEHELALSVDLSNRIDVPAVTLGFGYKFRWNKLLGETINYNTPFVYMQIDIVRFNKRFTKIWNKTFHH